MSGTREKLTHRAVYNERELHLGDGSNCYACRRSVERVLQLVERDDCLANNKQTRRPSLGWSLFFVAALLFAFAARIWSMLP